MLFVLLSIDGHAKYPPKYSLYMPLPSRINSPVMGKNIEARLPRGFRDIFSDDCQLRVRMIDIIRKVYESYGFLPLETPAVEFVDVLGKFLPDSDQPDAGIFGFKVDEQWVALRYDLTAPLSRIVAMYKELPQPFRRYQVGPVWRQEKPGPGRYREFYQYDIDIVGSESMAADAEICMVLADAIQALGFKQGEFVTKVSNRKILNAVIDRAVKNVADSQLAEYANTHKQKSADNEQLAINYRIDVMRCIDKLDRVGFDGVTELLQKGRKDPTGDFTPGCYLTVEQITPILDFLKLDCSSRQKFLAGVGQIVESDEGKSGVAELAEMDKVLSAAGYGDIQVKFDSQIVRGLAYYTGPVYEAILTIPTVDDAGRPVQFGSIAGGGRYDSLVERFTGQKMPATGASIGVDRLLVAYASRQDTQSANSTVLVTVMDKPRLADYQAMAQELRHAGIAAELYLGQKGFRGQIKYADQKKMPVAVIAGEDEFNKGEVTLKDLRLGAQLAAGISDRDQWRKDQPAQIQVPRAKLVGGVKEILERYIK
jgi:histidyl-tRNA synthetase